MMKRLVSLLLLCMVHHALFCNNNLLKTRYVVAFQGSKAEKSSDESGYADFDNVVDMLNARLQEQKDTQSVFAAYLRQRLEIMKAISDQITRCFLNILGKSDNASISDQDITNDYKRNKAIAHMVREQVKKLAEEFVPCSLFSSKNGFAILKKTKMGIFGRRYKYSIDTSALSDLNTYLAWVESLILVTICPAESFKKLDLLAPHLYKIYDFLSKDVTPQNLLILQLRNAYIKGHFLLLMENAYEDLQALYGAASNNPQMHDEPEAAIQLLALSLTLQAILNYNDNELRELANIENSAIVGKLDSLNESIISLVTDIMQWNDSAIKQFEDVVNDNLASWVKDVDQLPRFEAELKALKSQSCISKDALRVLYQNVAVFAYALQSQGVDSIKYAQLLHEIEALQDTIPNDLLTDFFDMQRNLLILST